MAQQPAEQQTPKNQKQAPEKTERVEPKTPKTRGENAAKPEATAAKQRGARNEQAPSKPQKAEATPKSEKTTGTETNVPGQPAASATPSGKQQAEQRRKGAAAGQQNARANAGAAAKKPDPQQVQQIKSQHANFHAQPKPQEAPPVTFNQSYRIEGSDQWQGPQYEVFRSYHPERHDEGWYRSRYNRVELIGGGYYYWNNGYWYPAWGYSPSAEYYAYDGPIYVGHRAEPPDRVIADVQAELQQMGYYQGEVDGLLGPLTRQALTAYQADQGLAATAAIDEPTLDSLGMG
jgi:hypothetical protein